MENNNVPKHPLDVILDEIFPSRQTTLQTEREWLEVCADYDQSGNDWDIAQHWFKIAVKHRHFKVADVWLDACASYDFASEKWEAAKVKYHQAVNARKAALHAKK